MYPCKDEFERDTHTQKETHKRGRGNVMVEAEARVMPPATSQGMRSTIEIEKTQRMSSPQSPIQSAALPAP